MFNLEEINRCQICDQKKFEDAHPWKEHKIKLADYFAEYFPRNDLLTNENIPFKSRESYFLTDFLSKINLKKYLKENTEPKNKEYCKEYLQRRKLIKNTQYTLSQVELRSVCFPSIIYLDKLFKEDGGYYKICEELGYINKYEKYDVSAFPQFNDEINEIIIDTRESIPLKFNYQNIKNIKIKKEKLDVGDYKFSDIENKNIVYFERKSGSDFLGTLSTGFERFGREIQRAHNQGLTLIVMVEEEYNNIMSFPYLPQYKFIKKIGPDFIFHNVRALIQEFPNLQFLFCGNKKKSMENMEKIFKSKGFYKNVDLQLMMDLKLI